MTTDRQPTLTAARRERPRRALVLALLAVAALVLAACGTDDEADGGAVSTVEVRDAWARTSPSGQMNGAAYMVLVGGEEDDRLMGVSVSPDVAARAELHETVMAEDDAAGMDGEMEMGADAGMDDDAGMDSDAGMGGDAGTGGAPTTMAGTSGMMTMQEVPAIDVAAGEEVALEPGGYHVMLLELAAPLVAGETVELTLQFELAGAVSVTAEVRTA